MNSFASSSVSASAAAKFGPYHGQYEGHARISMVLALVETVCLLVVPWIVGWIGMLRHPDLAYLNDLPMSPGWMAFVDLLGVFAAYAYYSLYKRISAKISDGVPGYAFLDRIRLSSTLLAHTVIALVILIVLKIR